MKTEEELKKETQEFYDKLMEKFGNETYESIIRGGLAIRKKFPLKNGKNVRIYTVAEFVVNALNGKITNTKPYVIEKCRNVYNLEIENSESLIKFYDCIKSHCKYVKDFNNIKRNSVKKYDLADIITKYVNSVGIINVISELETILESLKEERNSIQDRARDIDLEIEKLTREKENQMNLLCGGEEKRCNKKYDKEIRKRGFSSSTVYRIRKEFEETKG